MIYQVTKGDTTLQIDDNILIDKQPAEFRQMYQAARIIEHKDEDGNVTGTTLSDSAEFDNCHVEVYDNGRVIITLKQKGDAIYI